MAVFNTNQVRQFYVVSSFADNAAETPVHVSEASSTGAIEVKTIGDIDKQLFFVYKGADTVLKSDYIPVKHINYAKAVSAADMLIPLKKVELALDSNVNSGAPISGQDYVLRIQFRQFYGMSDEDQYFKDAAVHATAAMDNAKKFFDAMKAELDKAFSRELGATADSNPYLTFAVNGTGANAKLVITEKIQPWTLGIGAQERVLFDVVPTTVYANGDDVIWGTVTDTTPAKASVTAGTTGIGNGHTIADMEYFYMGERGDQYRMQGWPNYIPTTYLVDPNAQYHVLEIHYAFTDTGVNSYRTEKDITLVAPATAAGKAALNSVIGAVNTAAGIEIATIA